MLAVDYFFACEAIGDAAKYAPRVDVIALLAVGRNPWVSVVDREPGGARIVFGYNLVSMGKCLTATGDEFTISSPPGGPTQLVVTIPLLLGRNEPAMVTP